MFRGTTGLRMAAQTSVPLSLVSLLLLPWVIPTASRVGWGGGLPITRRRRKNGSFLVHGVAG